MMKAIIVLLSIAVASMGGMLMYSFQTGHPPFVEVAEEEEEPEEIAPVVAVMDQDASSSLSVSPHNAMIEELVAALQAARAEVADTRLELDKREKNLKELYDSYLDVRRMVETLQDDLETQLIRVEKSQDKNFKTLADVYAKMDSVSAARSLQHMDSERAALILSRMDSRSMAAVMDSAVSASPNGGESVAEWSDAIRRLSEMTGEAGL